MFVEVPACSRVLHLLRGRTRHQLTFASRAYRKKALLWHPDKLEQNKSEDGFYLVDGEKVDKAKAEAMFKDLNEANEVLTDPAKKRRFFPPPSRWAVVFKAALKQSCASG